MRTFELNGKRYNAAPIDFGLECDLEEMGLSIGDAFTKTNAFMRAYFSICSGLNPKAAAKEIEAHYVKNGNFGELGDVVKKEMEESDFFQAVIKNNQTDAEPEPEQNP